MSAARDYFEKNFSRLHADYPGLTLTRLEQEISSAKDQKNFLKSVSAGVPLEYISGEAFFYKSSFYVNDDVLIPRAETEIIVDLALQKLKGIVSPVIADVGTGCGNIILSILKELKDTNADAMACDISPKVLEVAEKNRVRLSSNLLKHQIEFILSDRLLDIDKKFDLIVTNPPYIKESERINVHSQVNKFEPSLALYLKDNEYEDWYRVFFAQAKRLLKDDGYFIMEGSEYHLRYLASLAEREFTSIEIKQDYNQCGRFLTAS